MPVKDKSKYESLNNSFSKSNTLISSKYKASLFEQKILNIALAKLQNKNIEAQFDLNDTSPIICEIKASELKSLMHNTGGSFYNNLKHAAGSMVSKSIGFINDNTKEFKYVALIVSAEYKNSILRIRFNDELREYLSPSAPFTMLELKTLLKYRSIYSLRLHEILLSRCYKRKKVGVTKYTSKETDGKHFEIDIDLAELKLCLGVVNADSNIVQKALAGSKSPDYEKAVEKAKEKSFNTWYEFRRKVIDIAIKEINEMDNGIYVEYEPIKGGVGAKVYAVKFFVRLGNDDVGADVPGSICLEPVKESFVQEQEFEVMYNVKSMIKEQLSLNEILSICNAAEYDFGRIQKAYEVAQQSGNIKNLVGFLIRAIEENYEKPKEFKSKKKNGFNNFQQREYDSDYYADIERASIVNGNIDEFPF